MAKKYTPSQTKPVIVKETPRDNAVAEPRYATAEMVEKALEHVIKVHGAAFEKLAK